MALSPDVLGLLIAPAKLNQVCDTNFGAPVVPEVRRTHSVSRST
jgi:hypothetical protein